MAFVKRIPSSKITVDIKGPDGNAFVILSLANKLAKQFNLDYQAIKKEMTSSNYDHLIKTFNVYFGKFVDIVGYKERR